MERALVTGGTGFIGSHLVHELGRRGVETHVLVRESTPRERLVHLPDRTQVVIDDGTVEGLTVAVEAIGPDVTFHLATHFVAAHTPADVGPLVDANLALPFRLAEALSAEPGLLVNTGTVWQHVDSALYRPKGVYAATKQAAEDLLRGYAELGLLHVSTLTLTDVYGPGDPRPKLLPALLGAARSRETLPAGSGRPYVDLVHVDDVVRAFLAVAEAPARPWSVFGAGSGAPLTVRDLVAVVEEALGTTVPIEWDARPDRPNEMLTPWSPGPPPPGWTPAIPLADGIRALVRSDRPGAAAP